MIIQTVRASKQYIREELGGDAMAFSEYDFETKKHSITVPFKVSTKTRLHEIAHCVLGHCLTPQKDILVGDYIAQEIEAEEWAFSKCGKPLSIEAVLNIAREVIKCGVGTSHTFNSTLNVLAKYKITLTKKERSDFWNSCREIESGL